MALNFPPNPVSGDQYTVGTKTYRWNGTAWIVASQVFSATSLSITDRTNATSTTTGAVVVGGGLGIGGNLWIGGSLYVNRQPVITTATFTANPFGGDDINVYSTGTTGSMFLRFDNISILQTVTDRGNSTTNKLLILK